MYRIIVSPLLFARIIQTVEEFFLENYQVSNIVTARDLLLLLMMLCWW